MKLDDKTELKLNIKWVVQLVAFIVTLVYGYAKLDSRIAKLEHTLDRIEVEMLNKPQDVKQDTQIERLERDVEKAQDNILKILSTDEDC